MDVNANAKIPPKMYMKAMLADDDILLPVCKKSAAVPAVIDKAMAIPMVEIMNIFLRPMTSWNRVPIVAKIQPSKA